MITFDPSEDQRRVIEEVLEDRAGVTYLTDLVPEDRAEALATATAMLSWNWNRELPAEDRSRLESLRFVQFLSAGLDHVPFADVPQRVSVAGNSGAYAGPMAEHTVAMILALAKHLPQRHRELADGRFDQGSPNHLLEGSACGVVGFGGIGTATARLLRAFGCAILAVNTSGRTDEPVDFVGTLDDLDRVLQASDAIILSIPLTRRTRGLIGRRELGLMKPTAILVNVARGALVDEAALYDHLRSHPEFGAAIDAWWEEPFASGRFQLRHPFFELPNLLGSPHNSAIVPGALTEAARAAAQNVLRFVRGEEPTGVVDPSDYA